jgi:hypothetical protein
VVCSRVRELQQSLSDEVIALEIGTRNARVEELQKRWERLRNALYELLDQRGAEMAEIPGGGTGLLVKDYKGKEADRLVTRIDPGVVAMAAELRFVRRFGDYTPGRQIKPCIAPENLSRDYPLTLVQCPQCQDIQHSACSSASAHFPFTPKAFIRTQIVMQ